MFELTFLTDNEDIKTICELYWEIDSDLEFVYKVREIPDLLEMENSNIMPIVRENSLAQQPDWKCEDCSQPYRFSNRTDFIGKRDKLNQTHIFLCEKCQKYRRNVELEARRKKEEEDRRRKDEMIRNTNLLKVERISVILAALLGAIAFFWQVSEYFISRQERVELVLWCIAKPPKSDEPDLLLEVINKSERPIYLKDILIEVKNNNNFKLNLGLNLTPEIGSNDSNLDILDVGASRDYHITEDLDNLIKEFHSIYVIVKTPNGEIQRTERLDKIFQNFTLLDFEQDYSFNWLCNSNWLMYLRP